MESANILKILIFLFKDEIKTKKIELNNIKNLFSLRNKSVHYTPTNSEKVKIQLNTLIEIWLNIKNLFIQFEEKERFTDFKFSQMVDDYKDLFEKRWLNEK